MLNKDELYLFVDDGIFLTLCCMLDNHTQVMSYVNMIVIVTRIVVKLILYFPFHLVQL
jgi:hypothetical protein